MQNLGFLIITFYIPCIIAFGAGQVIAAPGFVGGVYFKRGVAMGASHPKMIRSSIAFIVAHRLEPCSAL